MKKTPRYIKTNNGWMKNKEFISNYDKLKSLQTMSICEFLNWKKLIFIAVIFLISCSKEETQTQPTPLKVAVNPLPITSIDISGIWYDYTHVSGGGYNVPVKFSFYQETYSYSEFTANSWHQLITTAVVYRNNNEISMPLNTTNYKFFGTILNDSTIEITQYSTPDTLAPYLIHKGI